MSVLHTPRFTGVSNSLKAKLLWAFDELAAVDSGMFLTILEKENVVLSAGEMTSLISEVSGVALGMVWSKSARNPYLGVA